MMFLLFYSIPSPLRLRRASEGLRKQFSSFTSGDSSLRTALAVPMVAKELVESPVAAVVKIAPYLLPPP